MTDTYDLIVIGAGMAGVAAANKCATQGWKVAIVDELPYGGTCALRGCDPKKILRRGAEIIDSARLLAGKGIDAERHDHQLGRPDEAQAWLHRPGPRRTWKPLSPATVSRRCTAPPRSRPSNRLAVDDVAYESAPLPDRHRRPPPAPRSSPATST